jgi:redox-regulated HSP33 family molecular chaperone
MDQHERTVLSGHAKPSMLNQRFSMHHSPFTIRRLAHVNVLSAVLVCAFVVLPGCSKNEPAFEIVTLEGKIEEIQVTSESSGEITVLYYSEKNKQDMIRSGLVGKETEIMINGAIAKLTDLREGDRIRGEVRVDKKNQKKTPTALKIYVDRANTTPSPQGG